MPSRLRQTEIAAADGPDLVCGRPGRAAVCHCVSQRGRRRNRDQDGADRPRSRVGFRACGRHCRVGERRHRGSHSHCPKWCLGRNGRTAKAASCLNHQARLNITAGFTQIWSGRSACPNNRAKISCSGLSPATAGESRLQPELAQRGVIIGPSPQWPMVLAFGFLDWEIVDAGDASAHQSLLIKFPILVAIAAEPIAAVVMPFVRKPYCDTVLTKGPDLLNQAVIQLPAPLARQKCLNGGTALKELRSISPDAVHRIRKRNTTGIARIPCVFGHASLLRGALDRERREWRTAHLGSFVCCLRRVACNHNERLFECLLLGGKADIDQTMRNVRF